MLEITKLHKIFLATRVGVCLLFAPLIPLAAQTSVGRIVTAAAKKEAPAKFTAPQIIQQPIHFELPAAMAKEISAMPSRKVATPSNGLVTIMSENFEGDFPTGSWYLGARRDYTWAKRSCAAHDGTFSAWAIGGGTIGSSLACGANYPNPINMFLFYGPFDLSDANWAAFSFFVSFNLEPKNDFLFVSASDDGTTFSGFSLSGTSSGQWFPYSLALTAVPSSGNIYRNLTGKSAVWIAFFMFANSTTSLPNGAFIDDVLLQKGMVNAPAVVSSFPSPGPSPQGLTFDGANLWSSDGANDRIYKLTTAGSLISSFASPGSNPTGLAWDEANLWNTDLDSAKLYSLSTTGTVLSSFSTPGRFPSGLVWNGAGFWHCDGGVPTIWKLDPTGGIAGSFSPPGTFHNGLTWDKQNLWLVDTETLLIYKIDTTGKVLDHFLSPVRNPTGLAWDNGFLWASDGNTDRIYKLYVQQFATDVGVAAIDLPDNFILGNSVPVRVVVKNFGTATQSNFPLSYRIDNGQAVTENFTESLAAGASAIKTFAMPWMPANTDTYRFTAWTALAGDAFVANDTLPTPKQVIVLVVPTTPTLVSPADGAQDQFLVLNLKWNSASSDVVYRLQIATNPAFTTTVFDDSTITTTQQQVGPLQQNTTYYWRVKAMNSGGTSPWSSPVWNFTTKLTAPATPALVSPADRAQDQLLVLILKWNPASNDAVYRLQIGTSPTFTTIVFDDSTITNTQQQVGPLRQNTAYYWRVKAKNMVGMSDYSTVWRFTTTGAAIELPPPQNFVLSNRQNNAVTLQWAAGVFTRPIRGQWLGSSVSFVVTPNGTAVDSFKIGWQYSAGCGTFNGETTLNRPLPITNNRNFSDSDISGTFTIPETCSGNFSFIFFHPSCGNVTITRTWTARAKIPKPLSQGFKLYRDAAPLVIPIQEKLIQVIQNPNATNFTDNTVSTGGTYYYILTTQYDAGESESSNEVQALLTGVLADQDVPREFSLGQNYPNPFNPTTTIAYALPQAEQVELRVYDLNGHQVHALVNEKKEAGEYNVEFDAATLPTGVYFYQLRAGHFVKTRKLIVVR